MSTGQPQLKVNEGAVVAFIPARLHSKRLPGKPLLKKDGHSLLWHTYKRAENVGVFDQIFAVTDDGEIAGECQKQGLQFILSANRHDTGTSRVCDAAATVANHVGHSNFFVLNWQVDEPSVDQDSIVDMCAEGMDAYDAGRLATLHTLVSRCSPADNASRDSVKAICDGFRAIDFVRNPVSGLASCYDNDRGYGAHIGVYFGHASQFFIVGKMKSTKVSRELSLEQLAWMENGWNMIWHKAPACRGINTKEDYKRWARIR